MSEMSDADLVAAYLDGVTELTADERQRVETLLATDPDARADADASRAMIDQLRALPGPTDEPDFRALGDRITGALPARPMRSRAPIYLGVLAVAAMVLAYLAIRGEPATPDVARAMPAVPLAPHAEASSHIWLGDDDDDGDLDVDTDQTQAAIDALVPGDLDFAAPDSPADAYGDQFGAQIDTLDDAAMDRVEHWLAEKG